MMLSHILNQELKELDQVSIPIQAGSTVFQQSLTSTNPSEDGIYFKRTVVDPVRAPSPKMALQTTNHQLPSPDSQTSAVSEDSKVQSFDEVLHTQLSASFQQQPVSFEAKKHAFVDDSLLPAPPAAAPLPTMQRSRSTSTLKRGKICSYCGCDETPMWRNGPPAFKVLCNKYGVVCDPFLL